MPFFCRSPFQTPRANQHFDFLFLPYVLMAIDFSMRRVCFHLTNFDVYFLKARENMFACLALLLKDPQ